MPATEAPPPANPNLKPAGTTPLQLSALSGKSPADVFAESGGKPPPDEPVEQSDFGAGLRDAQSKAKGGEPSAPSPTPNAPEPPASTLPAPKIPSLPEPVETWKPRGETAKHFDTLKQKHADEIATLKARYEMLENQLKNGNPEVEVTKKRLSEYETILRDVAIERDPQFKQKYDTQTKVAIDAAKMAAGDSAEKLGKLLATPNSPWRDEQISKLVEELPASAKRRVEAALINLEQIDIARNVEIENARQNFDMKQSALLNQDKEIKARQQQQMQSVFDGIQKQWTEKHPFFQKRDGDDKYNAEVQQSLDLAKQIFMGDGTPEELAMAAFWAASGDRVLKGWMKAMKELEAANKTIDKLRGVEPGDGKSGSMEGEQPVMPQPGNTAENMRYFGRGLQEAQRADAARKRGAR